MKEKLGPDHYRYFATLDEDGVHVLCERYVVIGETQRCWYVIRSEYAHYAGTNWSTAIPWRKKLRKRVLKESSGRRYCYPDKIKAMESFATRQRWRIAHANRSIAVAELALSVARGALEEKVEPHDRYQAGQNEYTRSLRWADC